jgi:hypothetical protein
MGIFYVISVDQLPKSLIDYYLIRVHHFGDEYF